MTAVEWSEVIRNWALVAAAALGVGIAWWRAVAAGRQARAQGEQADMGRREHVAEIFAKAVGQLTTTSCMCALARSIRCGR